MQAHYAATSEICATGEEKHSKRPERLPYGMAVKLKYDRLKPKMAPEYAAMTEAFDESVGWITRALKELGLEENTVVILFSDNGAILRTFISKEMAANNEPFRDQKGSLYEGGIRVPLIIK